MNDAFLSQWTYDLPPDRIATHPVSPRDASRLLQLPLAGGEGIDRQFHQLPQLLQPGDLLVLNDTRVMPARLRARRASGGAVELLVLEPGPGPVRALARPARRLAAGERLDLSGGGSVEVLGREGEKVLLSFDRLPAEVMAEQGEMPLPPYLHREAEEGDRTRYQTVYAGPLGAAAAPTAGLHFTPSLLEALAAREVSIARVTLHVGIATFRPLREEDLERGRLHHERYEVSEETAGAIAATRAGGGRVIAVGTTTARTLEATTPPGASSPVPGQGSTDIFIRPPYDFRGLDGLITNFHLPGSSLLMMVAGLIGRERLLHTYQQAIARGYRFYSYGDAMLIL
ncbi:MAG: tRNA preQ1(34) S-adenosylmethionine ribosyltransferase-isomerase QueA [Deltaproteobacteria bacterium]|nr:tRNA preQ1(34) S-adenosylmethionine ribosyltransferase-isomerase QueA [Deltaproteobacteria bacterium]